LNSAVTILFHNLLTITPNNMTSDSTPTPYVASSSGVTSGYNAFHAFDGLDNTA
jgi:hypothetical protein